QAGLYLRIAGPRSDRADPQLWHGLGHRRGGADARPSEEGPAARRAAAGPGRGPGPDDVPPPPHPAGITPPGGLPPGDRRLRPTGDRLEIRHHPEPYRLALHSPQRWWTKPAIVNRVGEACYRPVVSAFIRCARAGRRS